MGTEPLKGLRQFATNRSATDDGEPCRTLRKIQHRFVGEIASLGQSGDRRFHGARAGRNDRPFEPQGLCGDFDRIRTGKAGFTQEDIDAKFRKARPTNLRKKPTENYY
jgi:hypothetical protein